HVRVHRVLSWGRKSGAGSPNASISPRSMIQPERIHSPMTPSVEEDRAMTRMTPAAAAALLAALTLTSALPAHVRVTPKERKGGKPQGEPWAEVPEGFRNLTIPEWPLPTDLKRWQDTDRPRTRAALLKLLREMPARPDPAKVKVLSKEDQGDYVLERFEFHNGVDMVVPGLLLIPKHRKGPAPAVVALHGHCSSKESVCTDTKDSQLVGPLLAKKSYVVAAIDGYFTPGRVGKGPGGAREGGRPRGQPLQALPVARAHPLGHDAARRAVLARLPRDTSEGR